MSNLKATQIIILGGGGDLSQRKLLPALFDLYLRDMLPAVFNIIGLGRTQRTDQEYQDMVKSAVIRHVIPKEGKHHSLKEFCDKISYLSGSFGEVDTYRVLNTKLEAFDKEQGSISNRLFYLAVPPNYYEQIFTELKASGAATLLGDAWTHILVEKPFGKDLKTAQALDAQLASLYREEQIFRIDHYLAKEAVQNILSFRFANTLIKTSWDKDSVSSVHINMSETIDVGHRADFYEGVGALRDVGQNHLLQLLALVAMREPKIFDTETIRLARCEVLRSLRAIGKGELAERVLRGQYEDYQKTTDIPDDSQTETYFELKVLLDLPEWEGVPFYLSAGKALDREDVSIVIKLKDIASGLFETASCFSVGNQINLTISPEQTMAMTINAKMPGLGYQLETRTLSFACKMGDAEIKNSYEKVLYDAIVGDQTLFTRTEEVLAAWKFITPILEQWHKLPLYTYQKGTTGPDETIIK